MRIVEPIAKTHTDPWYFLIMTRKERINAAAKQLTRPPQAKKAKRVLRNYGLAFDDLTDVEKIDLFA